LNKHNVKLAEQNGDPIFDKAATCTINGIGNPNDECCGDFPERKPYSSVTYACCLDGSVRAIGNCP